MQGVRSPVRVRGRARVVTATFMTFEPLPPTPGTK